MKIIKIKKNKKNTKSKILIYHAEHSFSKLKNVDDFKRLSLNSMFSLMREHHKKISRLKHSVREQSIIKTKKRSFNQCW